MSSRKMFLNGEKERKCFYITLMFTYNKQAQLKKTRKRPFFPRLLCDAYVYIYLNGSEPKPFSFIHTQKFDREFLIEGDTSAQFYCRNLFLPINKLHKLLRENLLLRQFIIIIFHSARDCKAIYVRFKTSTVFASL